MENWNVSPKLPNSIAEFQSVIYESATTYTINSTVQISHLGIYNTLLFEKSQIWFI